MTPAEKESLMREAMFSLVPNTNFQAFITHLREMRENAMVDASNDRVISDTRLLKTYMGEIRAYGDIIAIYDDFKSQVDSQSEGATQ